MRACGVARFAYNWGLDQWQTQYAACKTDASLPKPNEIALRRQLNAIKRDRYPWMLEVTKCAPQLALKQLGAAYKNFFAGRARYPTFRRKGVRERFSLSNDQFDVKADQGTTEVSRIRIPNLGWVRMREPLRFSGRILNATVSQRANRWFVSIGIDAIDLIPQLPSENQARVGVDLGVKQLATLSTGEVAQGRKALGMLLGRLKRLSRSLSRKVKGSANRAKAKEQLARLHMRIANVRKDALHKLTTKLVRSYRTIVIEDLNVKGMMRNRHLARAIADRGFGEFRRQLEYKAQRCGAQVLVASTWFPSSKLCSCCGVKNTELKLSQRTWQCGACGTTHDRDVNAAVNLEKMAVSSTVTVPGEKGSGLRRSTQVKPVSAKGKDNGKPA